MYFTAMTFDLHSPMTYRFLNSPECMHAEILSLFPADSKRPLFRLDDTKDGKIVYMVSTDEPDVERWNNRFAIERGASLCRTTDYERFLSSIKNGDMLHFRITAVPTRTHDGKKLSLDYSPAMEWMQRKIEENGAHALDGTIIQTGEQSVRFKKEPKNSTYVYYRARTYEGVLNVTNKDLFVRMLVEGIGRQKAYGCGLMTVVPLNRSR